MYNDFVMNTPGKFLAKVPTTVLTPLASLIEDNTGNLPFYRRVSKEVPQLSSCRIPWDDHHPPVILESNRDESPVFVDAELARVHASGWIGGSVPYHTGILIDRIGEQRVRGDLGGVSRVEVRDHEIVVLQAGGYDQPFVIGLGLAVSSVPQGKGEFSPHTDITISDTFTGAVMFVPRP